MVRAKKGFPEENEIVLTTVTSVQHHSVFCNLDEYGKTGLIHISEVSPGRIRNLRDYVVEGKKVICKVLRIDLEKGHIDLSLRRVTEAQRRKKADDLKQEQKAEKIVEFVAEKSGKPKYELINDVTAKADKDFETMYACFEAVVEEDFDLTKIGIDKDTAKALEEVIRQRIKPKEVIVAGNFSIESYDSDGLERIKEAFSDAEKIEGDYIIRYKGAGKYYVEVKASNYPEAEEVLKKITDIVLNKMEKVSHTESSFARIELK